MHFFKSCLQNMKRYQKYSIAKILPRIRNGKNHTIRLKGFEVKANSVRLLTFKTKGLTCAYCRLKATHFWLEGFGDEKPHLNLYGIKDGKEILFTKDHILPRSRGGSDKLENMRTMCEPCNVNRGNRWVEHYEGGGGI